MNEQVKTCPKHPTSGFYQFKQGNSVKTRCKACNVERVSETRRKTKRELVRRLGGRCVNCGYDKYIGALEFHHHDQNGKEFAISNKGSTRSLEKAWEEAKKCKLLCANCHREEHENLRSVWDSNP
jgi:hypothetical protein